jgi:3-oxoacyl-[acyl-carrier-protein] synthase-3
MALSKIYSVISGTGSYIPSRAVPNDDFLCHRFYDPGGVEFDKTNREIIDKLEEITGIAERRYVDDDLVASDIAHLAALKALTSSGIDKESLDYLIVAHNFGDVKSDNRRSDFVPTLAARVKNKLQIENPHTIAYDLPFGCPGWLQAVIQANYYLRSGDAQRALVIGAETLSRVSDPHDRDSMIYADGAGAAVLEARSTDEPVGVLAHATRSDTFEHAFMLWMDRSFGPEHANGNLYLKMDGHRLYQYAISTVPGVVKESLDRAGVPLERIDKILIHQANAKLDEAILRRIYKKYGAGEPPPNIMPMIISNLGNSSVATLPILFDMLLAGEIGAQSLRHGDYVVFASVGAGMNINSVVYRMP